MNQEFDRAVSEIRNEPIPDAVVEAAAARVWARLAAETGQAAPPHISGCDAFQALIPELRAGNLDSARATLLRDHLHECVACRRVYEGRVVALPARAPGAARAFPYRLAAAAVILAAAGVSVRLALDRFGGYTGNALVASVNGSLFAVSPSGIRSLAAGAQMPDGVEIRTAKDSTAMLTLRDGSQVEMRERSAFTADEGARDITLRLNRGSLIVQAAHRASGHLFVSTADCRVAVTGTIFGVTAGAKGSRVSVVQGEVHVDRENRQQVLKPGNQLVTSADLEAEPVREDLAWSANRVRYESILASLGQALSQIPQPGLRYDSRLLGRLPANVLFYASIPNLAQYLGEAQEVFSRKLAQSPDLETWWRSHGGHAGDIIEKLRAASEYLGDEIAVFATPDSDGPVFLAEIKRPGFADFLKQAVPAGSNAPAEIERNGLALVGTPRMLDRLSGVLDSANGGIQSTPFFQRVEEAFHRGAGFLVCVNFEHGASAQSGAEGLGNAAGLLFDESQVNGAMEARVTLDFNGARTGIASWLAAPAPMGALDFVSPEATAAAAAVVPDGANIAQQLKLLGPGELGGIHTALGRAWAVNSPSRWMAR